MVLQHLYSMVQIMEEDHTIIIITTIHIHIMVHTIDNMQKEMLKHFFYYYFHILKLHIINQQCNLMVLNYIFQ